MHSGPPRRRRARPVADAPIAELLGRSDEIAKGWLLALLERAPLDGMPAILAGEMATDGPRLFDAVVRAIGDDTDLRRLEPGGALEPLAARAGQIAGAGGSADGTAAAVDVLGEVMWAAVREELRSPDPDLVAELAERIGVIVGLVRAAALRHGGAATVVAAAPDGAVRAAVPEPAAAPAAAPEALVAVPGPAAEGAEPRPGDAGAPREYAEAPAEDAEAPREAAKAPREAADAPREDADAPREDADAPAPPFPRPAPPPERRPLWVGAFQDELVRAERSGGKLSLLLAELEDADRLLEIETESEATATFGRFAQALRDAVRRQDILASESESRAWVIARDTGRHGAQALAARIAASVRDAPQWRGAPMAVTIGVAVHGEDGHDAPSLIEVAEEARFAAAASGIAVVPSGPPPPEAP